MNRAAITILVILLLGIVLYNLNTRGNTEGLENIDQITQTIGIKDSIPYGYYQISTDSKANTQTVAQIPYGFSTDKSGKLIPLTKRSAYSKIKQDANTSTGLSNIDISYNNAFYKSNSARLNYDTNNYNLQYHDDPSKLNNSTADNLAQTGTWILDSCGNKILVPWSDISNNITYYQPGSYPYGPSNYVPSYENSVYLSTTSGQSQTGTYYDMASIAGGFCANNSYNPLAVEEVCNSLDKNTCASTTCCVLLGGQKCVAGSQNGPDQRANYSDVFVTNKDFYYYQGKCYGNCNQGWY